jgi:hypothetical protein
MTFEEFVATASVPTDEQWAALDVDGGPILQRAHVVMYAEMYAMESLNAECTAQTGHKYWPHVQGTNNVHGFDDLKQAQMCLYDWYYVKCVGGSENVHVGMYPPPNVQAEVNVQVLVQTQAMDKTLEDELQTWQPEPEVEQPKVASVQPVHKAAPGETYHTYVFGLDGGVETNMKTHSLKTAWDLASGQDSSTLLVMRRGKTIQIYTWLDGELKAMR